MNYKKLATEARKKVLELIHKAGTSHIASNFSVIDIATVLYENLKGDDDVVWSKGWAAATIYYFLWKQGKITREQLESFPNPPFLGLAEPEVPGVLVAGGSCGHGLPVATGMAWAKKFLNQKGVVHCIMSDGELNEGTTWESAEFAQHHKLNNLKVWLDVNKWQAMGRTKEIIDYEPIANRWLGHNWNTFRINGHNYKDLLQAVKRKAQKPLVIICDTIKGKGVKEMEDHLLYHYRHVDKEVYDRAMKELA